MKQRIIISLLLVINMGWIKAQQDSLVNVQNDTIIETTDQGNYFHLNIGSGFHNLEYSPENGDQKGKMGFTFDLGYRYFFNPNWGFGVGLGLHNFRSKSTLNYVTEVPATDNNSESFVFRTYYRNWKEKQKAYYAEVPIGMYYQKRLANNRWKFQTGLGFKIFLPIIAKYDTDGGEIETTGYYEQYNEERTNDPDENFLSHTSFPSKSIDVKPVFGIFGELGFFYALNQKWDLYMGLYGNYGTNNTLSSSDAPLYQQNGTYNGVLESNQVNDAHLISFGIKLGISLHTKKTKDEPQEAYVEDLSQQDTTQTNASEETVENEEMEQQPEQNETNTEEVAPANEEKENASEEIKPVNEESEPSTEENVTQNEENEPTTEGVKPANEEGETVSEEIKPVNEESEPSLEETNVANEEKETGKEEINPENESTTNTNETIETENNETEPLNEITVDEDSNNNDPEFEDEPQESAPYVQAVEMASKTNIKFEYGSDDAISNDDAKLKSLAELLKSNPDMKIRIVGHTCDIGSHEVNTRIGLERANTVKNKLLQYGAPNAQIKAESKAFDEPLVPNTSEENRAKNRRVQIIVEK